MKIARMVSCTNKDGRWTGGDQNSAEYRNAQQFTTESMKKAMKDIPAAVKLASTGDVGAMVGICNLATEARYVKLLISSGAIAVLLQQLKSKENTRFVACTGLHNLINERIDLHPQVMKSLKDITAMFMEQAEPESEFQRVPLYNLLIKLCDENAHQQEIAKNHNLLRRACFMMKQKENEMLRVAAADLLCALSYECPSAVAVLIEEGELPKNCCQLFSKLNGGLNSSCVGIMVHFSTNKTGCKQILQDDAIKHVVSFFSPISVHDEELIIDCYGMIGNLIRLTERMEIVIKSKVLPFVLEGLRSPNENVVSTALFCFQQILDHIVDKSVLKGLSKPDIFGMIDKLSFESQSADVRNCLKILLPKISKARALVPRICANPACQKVATAGKKFQTCSACGSTPYCSKECQAAHWKEHKSICKLRKNTTPPSDYSKSLAMKTYLELLPILTVRLLLDGKILRNVIPTLDLSSSYEKPQISYISPEELKRKIDEFPDWQYAQYMFNSRASGDTLIFCTYPSNLAIYKLQVNFSSPHNSPLD